MHTHTQGPTMYCVPHIQNTCAAIVCCIVASSCSLSVCCRKGLPGRCQLFGENLLFYFLVKRHSGGGNQAETKGRKASSCQHQFVLRRSPGAVKDHLFFGETKVKRADMGNRRRFSLATSGPMIRID